MLLNASAILITLVILAFHVYGVAACGVRGSPRCRATTVRGGVVGKMQLLAKVVGLVVISIAIASSSVSATAVMVSTLVLCLAAGTYEMITGCMYAPVERVSTVGEKTNKMYKNPAQSALCRANLTELLALGGCIAFIALLMILLLGDKLT